MLEGSKNSISSGVWFARSLLECSVFCGKEKSCVSYVIVSLILKENAGRRQTKPDGPNCSVLWECGLDVADINARQLSSLE